MRAYARASCVSSNRANGRGNRGYLVFARDVRRRLSWANDCVGDPCYDRESPSSFEVFLNLYT